MVRTHSEACSILIFTSLSPALVWLKQCVQRRPETSFHFHSSSCTVESAVIYSGPTLVSASSAERFASHDDILATSDNENFFFHVQRSPILRQPNCPTIIYQIVRQSLSTIIFFTFVVTYHLYQWYCITCITGKTKSELLRSTGCHTWCSMRVQDMLFTNSEYSDPGEHCMHNSLIWTHNFWTHNFFIKLKDPQHFMGVVQVFKELLNNLSISS